MDIALTAPDLALPDISPALNQLAVATKRVIGNFRDRVLSKLRMKAALVEYFQALDTFQALWPHIKARLDRTAENEAELQLNLFYGTSLRRVSAMVEIMWDFCKKYPVLSSRQFKNFKNARNLLRIRADDADRILFSGADWPAESQKLKYNIGDFPLATPLRVFIEDDDTGKHVSCLEFPMLYGFGETERDALEMLDREIISLCEDAENFEDLPDEYRYAARLANMVMENA